MTPAIFQCDQCGKMVCNVCYCTGFPVVSESKQVNQRVDILDTVYHQLWNELHTHVKTAEQFKAWVKRVPSFGCSCASWLKDYIAANPPTDNLREYGWTLHNKVNAKLRDEGKDRPEFSWAEFETKYG
jgi:hypothetical protein